eukprot:TRINITY_DN6827_c0_g4_i1.p1 TRINITY_DN6827_c0_g4~~TRINITY_DN6827_c0_g4_i1.p1  ORF type:complete len:565 (-),score=145.92 TRINITY_DN6827_c0_g4_i1:141-1835(-)
MGTGTSGFAQCYLSASRCTEAEYDDVEGGGGGGGRSYVLQRERLFARSSDSSPSTNLVLGEELGSGAYGKVFCAQYQREGGPAGDAARGWRLAVKTFERGAGAASTKEAQLWVARRRSFEKELKMLSFLEHPHLVRLCASGAAEASLHLAMERCEGGELFQYICSSGRLTEEVGQRCFWQMASAVCYLHHRLVVHQDLKLENWLLLDEGRADFLKLCDFGSAVQISFPQQRVQKAGTLSYMAPEVHSGFGAGFPADCWSLGVTLYTMLVGGSPFCKAGEEASATVAKICEGAFVRGPGWQALSSESQHVVQLLLCVDSAERLTAPAARKLQWTQGGAPRMEALSLERLRILEGALARFARLDVLQQLVLTACARLPPSSSVPRDDPGKEQVLPLYELFAQLDYEGHGRLEVAAVPERLAALGGSRGAAEAGFESRCKLWVNALDVDCNGYIDWPEWSALGFLTGQPEALPDAERLEAVFELLDMPTRDGFLSGPDLDSVVERVDAGKAQSDLVVPVKASAGSGADHWMLLEPWICNGAGRSTKGLALTDLAAMLNAAVLEGQGV